MYSQLNDIWDSTGMRNVFRDNEEIKNEEVNQWDKISTKPVEQEVRYSSPSPQEEKYHDECNDLSKEVIPMIYDERGGNSKLIKDMYTFIIIILLIIIAVLIHSIWRMVEMMNSLIRK